MDIDLAVHVEQCRECQEFEHALVSFHKEIIIKKFVFDTIE